MLTLVIGTNRPDRNTRRVAHLVEEICRQCGAHRRNPDFVEKLKGSKILPLP